MLVKPASRPPNGAHGIRRAFRNNDSGTWTRPHFATASRSCWLLQESSRPIRIASARSAQDPSTPLGARRAEAESRIAAYPAGTFTPFSSAAWTGTDYEGALACLRWPSPARPDPPDPPGAVYPDVPTLVLNGDLDTITASSGAREVARRFPGSTFVEVVNSVHVTALADWDLARRGSTPASSRT
jgi:pimeloyl-ACP methyl ester carboxylesterase